jgi:hypothetical protein
LTNKRHMRQNWNFAWFQSRQLLSLLFLVFLSWKAAACKASDFSHGSVGPHNPHAAPKSQTDIARPGCVVQWSASRSSPPCSPVSFLFSRRPVSFLFSHVQGGSPGHYLLGLRILNMLVSEMNQATPGRTLTVHRKVAVSFRDNALFQVGRHLG